MSAQRLRDERDDLAAANETDPPGAERAAPLLVGNNIDNPGNADALRAAARMFGWEHALLPDHRHPDARAAAASTGARVLDVGQLAADGAPIIALENAPGAEDLFRFRPPRGRYIVVAGNERRGIAGDVLRLADRIVQIPNVSARLNTLNVAAAAAIAVHHLACGGGRGRIGGPRGRPDVVLAAPTDAIEAGSVVRSAACFGWSRLFVDDRHHVWFDTDRVTRSLGRGAARRGRNPICVLPADARDAGDAGGARDSIDEVCVVRAGGDGEPLRSAPLTGAGRLVVIGDDGGEQPWRERRGRVREVSLAVAPGARAPFRLVASIVLAEIARQLGERPRG